jgi:hypothetical protein
MICEFRQLLRPSVLVEIARRAAQYVPPGGEAADNQTGIGRRRQPDGNIVSLVDHIDGSFAHGQINLDIGIGRQKSGNHRRDERNDMRGGIDAQRAARRRLQGAGDVVGLLEVGKDLDAAIVIGLADFGDADLPGGAVEKPRAEPILQRLDMVAYHRGRHVEAAACG